MKKTILNLGLLLVVLAFASNAFSQDLKWYGFNEGYKKAVAEKKVAVIDVYTDWCGWCKKMDKDTWAKKEVITALNKDFIAIKFNPELPGTYDYNGKKYDGKDLSNAITNNKLSGYPTTCYLITKTKKVYLEVGYKNAADELPLLAKYAKMK